ncbi:hypothetical protein WICPIJ_007097 [Wickerhamomyces pijperi]|uniref:Uncharacterized protein n=1 Tax=Wickerhamomyces pijperi TaxID=599730 RepID=A0A9P8TKD7_WICPI|nr:hypothetical protein WICPIJ_007097 [Wickerhamomyces pijperi]
MVPLVKTPICVYIGDCGFFLTERIGKKTVTPNSGWVTLAFFCLKAEGLMILSIFTGLLVNPSPTKVCFVIILFQALDFLEPVLITLNISSSLIPLTFGNGTENLSAFSNLFCLMEEEMALAVLVC